jgi:tRNA G26 N,N-dimethylase Trm1
MKGQYNVIKEEVINKLTNHKRGSDVETSNRIDETISKIKNENFDKLTFFKLKNLNQSL